MCRIMQEGRTTDAGCGMCGWRGFERESNDLYLDSRRGFEAFRAALCSMLERYSGGN